jgi:hypothetical protein
MPKRLRSDNALPFYIQPIEGREGKVFSVKNAPELLEEKGLVDGEAAIRALSKWPMAKVEELAKDLFDFLDQQRSVWLKENLRR